jgi:catechol 2,3-dioxygenase-like lactoylglutathione lyase family enzyme
MTVKIEKVSAITLKVTDMELSVRFYRDVLGMELIYGGPDAYFSSLRTANAEFPVLNLERGVSVIRWGRIILHVADVDAF